MKFIIEVFTHFFKSDTFQKGASLAYYAVFSFIPTLILIISVFGLLYGEQAVNGDLYKQLQTNFGTEGANQIEQIIKNHHTNYNSWLTGILGFAGLLLNASVLIREIRYCLNSIWNVKKKEKSGIWDYINKHLSSIVLLIGLFVVIFASTIVSSFIAKHDQFFHIDFQFAYIYEHLVSFVVMSFLFSLMFKFLGDAKINWRATISGGIFTGILFIFGKTAISNYVAHSHVSSTFGNASLLALVMLWVYYTSQIIFLGASFITIISERMGHEIVPKSDAVEIKIVEINQ